MGPWIRKVGVACERSLVSRRTTVKNLVAQHCHLVLYALRYPQPVKADERISDVIAALQVEDQPCRRDHHRLESAHEVGADADQHALPQSSRECTRATTSSVMARISQQQV